MKKTHKKIFGLFGLVLVVAVTIFAAFLPGPKTQATTAGQATDTITVRVVSSTPTISLSGIDSKFITSASQEVNATYDNIEKLLVTLKHDGETNVLLDNVLVDYAVGALSDIKLNLIQGTCTYTYQYYNPSTGQNETTGDSIDLTYFGYGDYVLTASGYGFDGGYEEKSLVFSFVPVSMDIKQDGGKLDVGLDYDADDGTGDGQVAKVVITIYDDKGNPVKNIPPAEILPPTDSYKINLSDYGLPSGTYTISAQAYDKAGNKLYKPFEREIVYDAGKTPVPNTGGVMGNLNISKTDYIITGLIIFSIVGISAAVFISRHDKKTGNGKRR